MPDARTIKPGANPKLLLTVQRFLREDRASAPRRPQILRWARAALTRDTIVTVRLVGEVEGRTLNRKHRGKDYATNVLSFVYGEVPLEDGLRLVGDIALCAPVIVREAAEQGKTIEAHYAHLVIHGLLHLQGYAHESEEDALQMEEKERAILASLGFADPYLACPAEEGER